MGSKDLESKHTPATWVLDTVKTVVGVCHRIGILGSTTKLNYACLYDDCYSDKPRDLQLLADARLIALAPTAPHECDIPGCPGEENKRKLDVYPELLEACQQALYSFQNRLCAPVTAQGMLERAIAKAMKP